MLFQKLSITFIVVFLLVALTSFANAEDITIRLSYKIILGYDGSPPKAGGQEVEDSDIYKVVREMNGLIASITSGYSYKYRLVAEIRKIGGYGTQVSQWFDTNFLSDSINPCGGGDLKQQFENEAKSNPQQYAWNSRAINIYINNNTNGGKCSFPRPSREEVIVIGPYVANYGWLHLHEIGHFFNLRHTHEMVGGCEDGTHGDCVSDTIHDNRNWTTRTEIAENNLSYVSST